MYFILIFFSVHFSLISSYGIMENRFELLFKLLFIVLPRE